MILAAPFSVPSQMSCHTLSCPGSPNTGVPGAVRAGSVRVALSGQGQAGQEHHREQPSRVTTAATSSESSSHARTVLRAQATPTAFLVTSSLSYREETHLPWSPGSQAAEPGCPWPPFSATKFESESGSQIRGGDGWGTGTFGGGGSGRRGSLLRGGTWRFRKKEVALGRTTSLGQHCAGG